MRLTSNPVLIGAVTVLVTVVAVFLAYNANSGLPFVPTTTVKVRVANGANLVKGNEVRSGGTRVGIVSDMRPVRLADGSSGAELTLKLGKDHGSIPRDSTLRIRPRSALGL
jgi:ABC-type transporter Mla subunit MlaD